MKRTISISLLTALLIACSSDTAHHEEMTSDDTPMATPPANMSEVMHSKIAWASSLLEAVATRDYDRVASNADALRRLSLESGFIAQDTVAYRTLAERFRADVTKLAADARKKNQSAVEADYHSVTESCFHCHAHMRVERFHSDMPGKSGM